MPPSCKKILFNIAQIAYQVLFFLVYLQKKKAKAFFFRGNYGARTHDLLVVTQTLSQLS